MPSVLARTKRLSYPQQRAAKLLSLGWLNHRQVAHLVGVRRETIWAWRGQPRFQVQLARLEQEADDQLRRRQGAFVEAALQALERLVDSPDPRIALAAIEMILRLNGRLP